MIQNQVAWITAGLFLVVLIIVRRFQKVLLKESPDGFHHVSFGLSLLSLTALARLFYTESMFAQVPFLSEPLFFDLAYWIGIIAGGTLLINGAANWLPPAHRRSHLSNDSVPRSDLLRRVQQLVGVENRIDPVLSHALQYMQEQAGLSYGAVFKFSRSLTRIELTATTSEFPMPREVLDEAVGICFAGRRREEQIVDLQRCLSESLPPVLRKPAAMIPIEVRTRTAGCFVLWKLEGAIDSEDRLALQLAADIVAHKIDRDQLLLARRSEKKRTAWLTQLVEAVVAADGSRRRVVALANGLTEEVPYDSLAVTIVPGGGGRTIRYSMAAGGNILVERAVEAPLPEALTAPAFYAGQTVVFGDLAADCQPDRREIISIGLVRSLISIPVGVRGEIKVVMTLASGRKNAYDGHRQETLEQLRPLVALAVEQDLLDLVSRRELSRFEKLEQLSEISAGEDGPQALLNRVACLGAEETGADVVRVAMLDKSGVFLASRAMVAPLGESGAVPPDGQLILPLMPLHDRAVRTGRIIDSRVQSVDELTAMEAHQVFATDLKRLTVVPLNYANRTVGVMTLAWLDNRTEAGLETSQRVFMAALAQVSAPLLSLGVSSRVRERADITSIVSGRRSGLNWNELPSEIDTGIDVYEPVK